MRNYWQLQAPDGGALHKCHSKAAVLSNRPHGWKGVAVRCRRSPRSELEVFCAQNELAVLAGWLLKNKCLAPAELLPRDHKESRRDSPESRDVRKSQLRATAPAQRAVTQPEQGSHK